MCWKCDEEDADLEEERDRYKAVIEWIIGQKDLFFAECAQAEEILSRCKAALEQRKRGT